MRTTVKLDDRLLAEAKQMAARSRKTLSEVIEDALRQVLSAPAASASRKPVKLSTFRGTGLQPGVDLDSSSALLELMGD